MKVKTCGHCWLRCGEISELLPVRCLVRRRVRPSPKVVWGVSHLCVMFLWQAVSLGPLPLQSVLCICRSHLRLPAAVSPNFPHLITVVFGVIEACEDSIDIVRIPLY
jgi:hypothetical protein